jgi:hypothetical protein
MDNKNQKLFETLTKQIELRSELIKGLTVNIAILKEQNKLFRNTIYFLITLLSISFVGNILLLIKYN